MINKSTLVVLLLIVIAGSAFAYYKYKEAKEAELSMSEDMSNEQLPLITIASINEDDEDRIMRLVINKPIVSILDNKEAAEKANSYIDRFILDQKELFYENVELDGNSTNTVQNTLNVFSLTTEVLLITPKVFILKLDQSVLYAHKSRSDQTRRYIMFDLDKGGPISSEELFPKAESMQLIVDFLNSNKSSYGFTSTEEIMKIVRTSNRIILNDSGLLIAIDSEDKNDGNTDLNKIIIPLSIIEDKLDTNLKEIILSKKEYIRMSEPETALE